MIRRAPPDPSARGESERGYALVAAVAAIGVFGALALAMTTATRSDTLSASSDIVRARAEAAADAGMAVTLHGLITGDAATLALIDGRPGESRFADVRLVVHIIDERGKVPINRLEDAQVERLLRGAGLDGQGLAVARDSLLDWLDADDDPHPDGAEADWYAHQGIAPRNAMVQSIEELGRVRGFTPALVERLRPIITLDPEAIPFDKSRASPQAIAVMADPDEAATDEIERDREQAGQRTALAFTNREAIVGRPLTIAIDAELPGGHLHRELRAKIVPGPAHRYEVHGYR